MLNDLKFWLDYNLDKDNMCGLRWKTKNWFLTTFTKFITPYYSNARIILHKFIQDTNTKLLNHYANSANLRTSDNHYFSIKISFGKIIITHTEYIDLTTNKQFNAFLGTEHPYKITKKIVLSEYALTKSQCNNCLNKMKQLQFIKFIF